MRPVTGRPSFLREHRSMDSAKLILATAVLVGTVGFVHKEAPAADTSMAPTAQMAEASTPLVALFSVEDMTHASCAIAVHNAMTALDGVVSVSTDLTTQMATVVFDPDLTTARDIARASEGAGYPALIAPPVGPSARVAVDGGPGVSRTDGREKAP